MRILITRPETQALGTAAKLLALGHEPALLPLTRVLPVVPAAGTALALPHRALAVTSAEALRVLSHLQPLSAEELERPFFAVGRATGQAAMEAGFKNVFSGSGDGGDLAEMVVDHMTDGSPESPLLYLAGVPRAGRFERMLENTGVPFVTAEIYEMVRVSYKLDILQAALVEQRVDAVLFYSRENARAFFELPIFAGTAAALDDTIFLCLSRNIANCLPDGYKRRAVVASSPNEDALLDLL